MICSNNQEMFLADFGLTRCELPKSPNIAQLPQAEAAATIMIYLGVCIHRKKPYF
jgi:hypothetical protein